MPHRLRNFLSVAVVATSAFASAWATETIETYHGTATELASRKPLYSEEHFLRYRDGQLTQRVVLYQCPNGKPFARKQVDYVDRFAPDFDTVDVTRGLHEGLRSKAGLREVFYRETASDAENSEIVPPSKGMVADAGFDEFVRGHWDALMGGQRLELDFLVPSRLGAHAFQVRHVRAAVTDGIPAQVFQLRLSGVLGLVVPTIEVHYSDAQRMLVRYEGLSNLQDAKGNHYKAQIVFPPKERRASDVDALRKAQSVALNPCG